MWKGLSRERFAWWMAWFQGRRQPRGLRGNLEMLAGVLVAVDRGWWWPCGGVGTTRRGMVDRQATTLMYAG